jgi:hypothetical protein
MFLERSPEVIFVYHCMCQNNTITDYCSHHDLDLSGFNFYNWLLVSLDSFVSNTYINDI